MAFPKLRSVLNSNIHSLFNKRFLDSSRQYTCAVVLTNDHISNTSARSPRFLSFPYSSDLHLNRRTFHLHSKLGDTYRQRMRKVISETKGRRFSDADAEARFSKREQQIKRMPDFEKVVESIGAWPEDAVSPEIVHAYLDGKLDGESE